MKAEEFGIGMVGLGGIANVHLEAYQGEGLRVVGGADPDPAARKAKEDRFGIATYDDAEELAARDDVHVLDVTVPHEAEIRIPLMQRLVKHGKPIVLQKPVANTHADALRIIEIAEEARVPLVVHHQSLFVPAFQAAHDLIQAGRIGDPYFCQIHNRGWWEFDHPIFGKNERWVLASMGIHHLALLDYWFGAWQDVYAMMGRDAGQKCVQGDTWSVLNIRYESGMRAMVQNNWSCRDDEAHNHPNEEVIVQGDRGTLTVRGNEVSLRTDAGEERFDVTEKWFPHAFGRFMRAYLQSLAEGRPFVTEGRSNLRVVGLMDAAYRSAEQGRVVAA
ncbi:Gfo/Idh/MocA family protein [Fimbriimonas ginsengisoli]|uniref:Oxidoreductase n=1 Tax=Fimbriimonas ginsengisoli Gsoil 348 TaxID=661478 RepID=A0A068NS40_FIMGI|nr:Gfo/Idh/MocA family oxidoreductase [Fimbriimonas ginsengisoli]AIE86266.1 oxidoreductase [Fimbriimonas ginsengisoli Gsoil 348]